MSLYSLALVYRTLVYQRWLINEWLWAVLCLPKMGIAENLFVGSPDQSFGFDYKSI